VPVGRPWRLRSLSLLSQHCWSLASCSEEVLRLSYDMLVDVSANKTSQVTSIPITDTTLLRNTASHEQNHNRQTQSS
jgi:hypothetical protein